MFNNSRTRSYERPFRPQAVAKNPFYAEPKDVLGGKSDSNDDLYDNPSHVESMKGAKNGNVYDNPEVAGANGGSNLYDNPKDSLRGNATLYDNPEEMMASNGDGGHLYEDPMQV